MKKLAKFTMAQVETRLHELVESRPAMPRPFEPSSEEGIAWHQAFSKWMEDRDEVLNELKDRRQTLKVPSGDFMHGSVYSKGGTHVWSKRDSASDPLDPRDGPDDEG